MSHSIATTRNIVESLPPEKLAEIRAKFLAGLSEREVKFYRNRIEAEHPPTMFIVYAWDLIQKEQMLFKEQ